MICKIRQMTQQQNYSLLKITKRNGHRLRILLWHTYEQRGFYVVRVRAVLIYYWQLPLRHCTVYSYAHFWSLPLKKSFYNSLCQERSHNFNRNRSINNPYNQCGKLPRHPFSGYNQGPSKNQTMTLKEQHDHSVQSYFTVWLFISSLQDH